MLNGLLSLWNQWKDATRNSVELNFKEKVYKHTLAIAVLRMLCMLKEWTTICQNQAQLMLFRREINCPLLEYWKYKSTLFQTRSQSLHINSSNTWLSLTDLMHQQWKESSQKSWIRWFNSPRSIHSGQSTS